ncbi:Zcf37 [Thalictrum thalictroides]|uniref:Zcf37 n=1 Tax=Thalictrum thalictroides TaxID=46969 RepID=A0A7J6WJ54_THATH|nr:Zcf37 [Thalictrum thalictroides]KAF5197381.1 Zcf37 [Thalictrum thalictroides]
MFRKPLFKGSTGTPLGKEDDSWSSSSTPKRSKSENSNGKNNKNPYAMSGRDKFATVLADLDKKRRTIYEQVGTEDISKVRFGYCDSKKWVPIVVRSSSKDHTSEDKTKLVQTKDKRVTHISEVLNKSQTTQKVEKEIQQKSNVDGKTKKFSNFYGRVNLNRWIQSCYDYPMVLVLVLSCLGFYGRVFAVICSSIWWFLVPRMKNRDVNWKGLMKKKDHESRLSEKKMESDGNASPKFLRSDVMASPKSKHMSSVLSSGIQSPKTNLSHGLPPRILHVNNKSW